MTRKNVKLAWVESETSRAISLKKRRLGLLKKVRELTILCDVRACMIMFSPNEVEPMVWPSVEMACDLLDDFFALPEIEKKKKETSLESHLKENTRKVHEQLKKCQKKNMEDVINQLMLKLNLGRVTADLNLDEIYRLISFSRDKIMLCRKRLGFVDHPHLRDPSVHPVEAQSRELSTTMNDVFVGGGQDVKRAGKNDEASKGIHIGSAIWANQSHYLMDQWFLAPSGLPKTIIHQHIGMEMGYENENPHRRNYLQYQGSSSNGNPNLEMNPIGSQMMNFYGMVGSVSQPLQHHNNMNKNPLMDMMRQPRQYPFDMNRDLGVNEERSNINIGDSQFHRSINTITTKDGLCQKPPPPPNGTTAEEGNVDTRLFNIKKNWPGINNRHF